MTFLAVSFILIAMAWSYGGKEIVDYVPYYYQRLTGQSVTVRVNGVNIGAEVERSTHAKEKGLSGRRNLPSDRGMLFRFETPGKYEFIMQDMRFALDIIWIQDGKIVEIWKNAKADTTPPSFYTPSQTASDVLEVRSGIASTWNTGDAIEIKSNGWFFR
jgi:uncharacterized membrane protein (UPF0127 family)